MKRYFFTDGSCRGNPGSGGFGGVEIISVESPLKEDNLDFKIGAIFRGEKDNTTNNRMEMEAILVVFMYASAHPEDQFIIYTDSAYCANMINNWIRTWAVNDWKTSKGKDIENKDLVLALWNYIQQPFFNAHVFKVLGHSGILGNELADKLATNQMEMFYSLINKNNLQGELNIWEICTTKKV